MSAATKSKKLFLSLIFISFSLILLRPFIVNQLASRGDGYLGYKMHNDAIRQHRKALLLDPRNSEIMNWLGYAYKSIGNKNKAIDTYKKAIKIDPQNIVAYHDLGLIYAIDKKHKLAKECFLKASSIPQEHTFYYYTSLRMLAACQEKLGEVKKAIETWEKMLEYYPDDEVARERIKSLGGDKYEK